MLNRQAMDADAMADWAKGQSAAFGSGVSYATAPIGAQTYNASKLM
jgi:hypothetical protein